ncbi:hypothetical protein BH160DRAFT_5823 [Burkholderia sp. H160]|nr:hypothetical protein BH160DRAFT_5823 [Burkholderia sp. H160]
MRGTKVRNSTESAQPPASASVSFAASMPLRCARLTASAIAATVAVTIA